MNILHVTQGYSPAIGGTEWLIQRVSEELANRFDDTVTVFTTDRLNGQGFVRPFSARLATAWEKINGVGVRRFPVWNGFGPFLKVAQLAAYRLNLPYNDILRSFYSGPIIPGLENEIRKLRGRAEYTPVAEKCQSVFNVTNGRRLRPVPPPRRLPPLPAPTSRPRRP
jgi:hypothetical protein